jgi:serine/threonine-protein kinase
MTDENWVGQTLAGKYQVEKVLGKGGMGVVLGARHLKLDEPVAIKVLRSGMMEVDGMVSRFLREARAASKIKGEHVARVTDVDTLEDGTPYMVMELLEGIDFSDLRKEQGSFPIGEAVGYVLEACEAIAEAHALGIVHRDLKPSNLFRATRRDGKRVVKVLDFGISKVEHPGEQDTTKTGQMMGSPKYMSPEQMTSMRDTDGRSDIWSLGAILYEFLAGRPPFVADTTPRVCAMVLNNDPAPPRRHRPDIPPELEAVVLRCLDKDPDGRFDTVAALVAALGPFSSAAAKGGAAQPLTTAPADPVPGATVGPWDGTTIQDAAPPKKAPMRIVIAALAGVILAGGLGGAYLLRRSDPPAPQAAADGTTAMAGAATASAPPTVAPAQPIPSALSPSDLPDVVPTAAPAPLPGTARPSASAKKAKPPDDPFGGRRN